jgi:O-acetyl-ADP-ribose deacetylase (regulator of RNase III)
MLYRQGDITSLEVDSIVNAANSRLGGVAGSHLILSNFTETDQMEQEVNPRTNRASDFTQPIR